ncbi:MULTISPECIES: MBL fold metallo-hydrolase [Rhizobium]|uniref:Metallo-beta-lactamase superfamily protein n=1 Tax=Rhizobium lusitanum TaxID=293958 RepID=A0A1C3W9X8_9HYPH|nr:MBL fold metallo-hydrolase [Rhizobium lusitanum]SCB36859.1 Metallo-beta-lactamase superfamily protein [Rhizobium lusitanum]
MLFNRRSMFTAGAVTALALSTPQIMTRAAFAAAPPKSDIANTGFYRFMLGEFEITVILDGSRIFDGPHPTFGADRDADEVVSLMKANFLPSDRMIGQFNPVLVNTGTDLILFDTGNGPEGREFGTGQLANRIASSGYAPSGVTIVAISHLHADHINGLMEGDRPGFSRVRYVVGQAEWDFCARELLNAVPSFPDEADDEPGECVMTRHGRSIHMDHSTHSRPTGGPAPVTIATAFSLANVLPVTTKISAITPGNTTLGLLGLTNVAAIGAPPEDPIHKTP